MLPLTVYCIHGNGTEYHTVFWACKSVEDKPILMILGLAV